jgi:hypothetical protein
LIQIKPFLFDFTSGPGFGEYYRKLIGGNKITLNDSIPFFGYPLTAYKNEFIGAISPQAINQYLSENEEKRKNNTLFDQLDSDSNPIVIKYTLK